jgi:transposase
MAFPQKDPLRALTAAERTTLEQVARAGAERADRVARAKLLLAVADGASFAAAARLAGRRSGEAVAQMVARFNATGLAALTARPGGAPPIQYGPTEAERILREARRTPDRVRDGTATWSLTTLRRALRTAPDGLPHVSTFTILRVLHDAGFTWQRDRTWCETGVVQRKRKSGVVEVVDPEAITKRGRSTAPIAPPRPSASRSGARTRPDRTRPSPSRAPPGSPRGCPPIARTNTSGAAPPSC